MKGKSMHRSRFCTLLISFLMLLAICASEAGVPEIEWAKTYGGPLDEYAFAVELLPDGFLVVGYIELEETKDEDVYLIKLNFDGDTVWTKRYGGPLRERAFTIHKVYDGGFIVSGYTGSYGEGLADAWLLRLDWKGDTLWTANYGGLTSDQSAYAIPTRDKGFIFTGFSAVYLMGDQAYIVKTQDDGDTLWTKKYGGTNQDYGKWIIPDQPRGI